MKEPKTTGATRRSRAQWRSIIAEWERSGLSQRAFCAESGIRYSSFIHQRHALRQADQEAATVAPTFVEVPLPQDSAPQEARSDSWELELELGAGVVVRLRRR